MLPWCTFIEEIFEKTAIHFLHANPVEKTDLKKWHSVTVVEVLQFFLPFPRLHWKKKMMVCRTRSNEYFFTITLYHALCIVQCLVCDQQI